MKKILLTLFVMILVLCGCTSKPQGSGSSYKPSGGTVTVPNNDAYKFSPFYKLDVEDENTITNLQIITKDKYDLSRIDSIYQFDTKAEVNEKGLDGLNISTSGQFSAKQFEQLAKQIKELAGKKKVYVLDLRKESHYFLNDIAVSWYELHNLGSEKTDIDDIIAEEEERFAGLKGETITAYVEANDDKSDKSTDIKVESIMSEKELVEKAGFTYVRLPLSDHNWPDEGQIEEFIDFVNSIDKDNAWIHIHCDDGKDRTGTIAAIYDLIKNPELTMDEWYYRSASLGYNYLGYVPKDKSTFDYKMYLEKADMSPKLYEYIEDNVKSNFKKAWEEWLEETYK